jgi:hypothetical protein
MSRFETFCFHKPIGHLWFHMIIEAATGVIVVAIGFVNLDG